MKTTNNNTNSNSSITAKEIAIIVNQARDKARRLRLAQAQAQQDRIATDLSNQLSTVADDARQEVAAIKKAKVKDFKQTWYKGNSNITIILDATTQGSDKYVDTIYKAIDICDARSFDNRDTHRHILFSEYHTERCKTNAAKGWTVPTQSASLQYVLHNATHLIILADTYESVRRYVVASMVTSDKVFDESGEIIEETNVSFDMVAHRVVQLYTSDVPHAGLTTVDTWGSLESFEQLRKDNKQLYFLKKEAEQFSDRVSELLSVKLTWSNNPEATLRKLMYTKFKGNFDRLMEYINGYVHGNTEEHIWDLGTSTLQLSEKSNVHHYYATSGEFKGQLQTSCHTEVRLKESVETTVVDTINSFFSLSYYKSVGLKPMVKDLDEAGETTGIIYTAE